MERAPHPTSKLFPYAIARLGGGSYDDFSRLELAGTAEHLAGLASLRPRLEAVRAELGDRLFARVEGCEDPQARRVLLRSKRDAFNGRALAQAERLAELAPDLAPLVDEYARVRARVAEVRAEALAGYEREMPSARAALRELSAAPALQKGLALSSHALLAAYRQAADPSFDPRKRDKLDLGLVKYLSRVHLKTSPFSTFSPVAPVRFRPDGAEGGSVWLDESLPPTVNDVRLNTYVCNFVLTLLVSDRATCRRLPVRLNPTVRGRGDELVFLVNYRNVEAFQTVRATPALKLLLGSLRAAGGRASVSELVDDVVAREVIDAPADRLEAYLYQLLDAGLLEPELGVSEVDPLWQPRLRELLAGLVAHAPHVEPLLEALEESAGLLERFAAEERAGARVELLRHLHGSFADAFRRAHEGGEMRPMGVPAGAAAAEERAGAPPERRFLTHLPRTFTSLPEQMVFEDVGAASPLHLPAGEVEGLAGLLAALLREMRPYDTNVEERLRMGEYLLRRYPRGATVPLLTFYEDYYRDEVMPELERVRDDQPLPVPPHVARRRAAGVARWQAVVDELAARPSFHAGETVEVSLDQLVRARRAHPLPDAGQAEPTSYAAFVQPFRERPGAPLMATLNTVAPGFGKMYGRFLEILPPEVEEALNEANREVAGDAMLVENSDASFFNANVHPPLLQYAVAAPGSRSAYPPERQVPVAALAVGLDESGAPQLVHAPTGARVFVLDLGFQVHAGRSKLYRLLDRFTLAQYASSASLLKALNTRLDPGREAFWVRPRVVFEGSWVLQRRAWMVPGSEIPRRLPRETDAAYFVRMDEWRSARGIPAEVFVSAFSKEHLDLDDARVMAGLRREDLKPQYVSFRSPFVVLLLERLVARAGVRVAFEEMLPGPGHLARFGGERFVAELLMQTYPQGAEPCPAEDGADGWVSVHAYHAGRLEPLLRDAVAPVVRELLDARAVSDFFFVRYGDGGPHVRLRLRAVPGGEARVAAAVAERLTRFLARHPSARDDELHGSSRMTRLPLEPNDSVRTAAYTPETERYGGPEGMRLAEEHFGESSAAVLAAIREKGDAWGYEKAMGTAIQMHLALAAGLGMTAAEAARWFGRLTEAFLPHAFADLSGSAFARLQPEQREHMLSLFQGALASTRAPLMEHHRAAWSGLHGAGPGRPWVDRWARSVRENATAFREADAAGRLRYPRWWFELHPDVPDAPGERLVLIFASLVHMTNNRLGILNRDEAYLTYVLASCLGDLAREEAAAGRTDRSSAPGG